MGRNLWKILLLLSVLCIFTGCSSSKGQDSKNEHNIKDEDEKEAFYQGEIMALKHAEYSECMCSRDGIVYTVASRYQEDGSYENQLSVIEVQGKETLYEMPFLTDEVEAVTVLDNGGICLLARSNRSMPSRIITVNEVGEKQGEEEIHNQKEFNAPVFFPDGVASLAAEGTVVLYDWKGKETASIDCGLEQCFSVFAVGDDLYVFGYKNSEREEGVSVYGIKKLDPDSASAGELIELKGIDMSYPVIHADGTQIYFADGSSVSCYDFNKGKMEKLFTWLNFGIGSGWLYDFCPLGDGKFFAVFENSTQGGPAEAVSVFKTSSLEAQERKVLTAAVNLSGNMTKGLEKNIESFNRSNQEYRVDVMDYSGYDDPETALELDMAAGRIPDIVSLSGFSAELFVKKGLLADLYPLMEEDGDIKKEDFIDTVRKAAEIDGKLYYMGALYQFYGVLVGGKNHFSQEAWCLDDMISIKKELPKKTRLFYDMSRQQLLRQFLRFNVQDFIKWEDGEADFTSGEFEKLLSFAKQFPDEKEPESFEYYDDLLKEDRLLFMDVNITGMMDIQDYQAVFQDRGGLLVLPYPGQEKNGELTISFYDPALAITEKCSEKAGAWDFLKQFFTVDYQVYTTSEQVWSGNGWGFPVTWAAWEKRKENASAKKAFLDENGKKVQPAEYTEKLAGAKITHGALTEEELEIADALAARIGKVSLDTSYHWEVPGTMETLCNIVLEEAQGYFLEEKTAEETAEVVENRVGLFLSERS